MAESRKPLSIAEDLLDQANLLEIDASEVAERALLEKIRTKRAQAETDAAIWSVENAKAIASLNEHFERNGFPFPQYRRY